MTKYKPLPGFLSRWTILKLPFLHIRLHAIASADGTPFLHSHPFAYVSLILSGEYSEQVLGNDGAVVPVHHKRFSVIIRRSHTMHRIAAVRGDCKTLFFAIGKTAWSLRRHAEVGTPAAYHVPASGGMYTRVLGGEPRFAKFDGFWYVSSADISTAHAELRPSIHQVGPWCACDAMSAGELLPVLSQRPELGFPASQLMSP